MSAAVSWRGLHSAPARELFVNSKVSSGLGAAVRRASASANETCYLQGKEGIGSEAMKKPESETSPKHRSLSRSKTPQQGMWRPQRGAVDRS